MAFLKLTFWRSLLALATIFATIAVSFFLMRLAPGGPFDQERRLAPEVIANLNAKYNLDKPLPEQFYLYVKGLLHGDFGPSMIYPDLSVADLVSSGLWASLQIGTAAIAIAVILGVFVGAVAARRLGGFTDKFLMGTALFGIVVPSFVLAPLMSLLLAVNLQWFAVAGWGSGGWRNLTLPIVALAIPQIGVIARLMRGSLADVLGQMHIRTAQAKGLSPSKVLVFHALRQAMFPVISYLGPAMAGILTGSIVIEQVFGIDGLGRHFVKGALDRDYPLVMGTVIVYTTFIMLFNLLADLLYALLDPRIRHASSSK